MITEKEKECIRKRFKESEVKVVKRVSISGVIWWDFEDGGSVSAGCFPVGSPMGYPKDHPLAKKQ